MTPKDLDLSAAPPAMETCLCISLQSSPADIAACPKARRWNSPLSKARKAGRQRTLEYCSITALGAYKRPGHGMNADSVSSKQNTFEAMSLIPGIRHPVPRHHVCGKVADHHSRCFIFLVRTVRRTKDTPIKVLCTASRISRQLNFAVLFCRISF